jgi:hypothetical protein
MAYSKFYNCTLYPQTGSPGKRTEQTIINTKPNIGETYGKGFNSRTVTQIEKEKDKTFTIHYIKKTGEKLQEGLVLWNRWLQETKKFKNGKYV